MKGNGMKNVKVYFTNGQVVEFDLTEKALKALYETLAAGRPFHGYGGTRVTTIFPQNVTFIDAAK
jgi:hypothetical protein